MVPTKPSIDKQIITAVAWPVHVLSTSRPVKAAPTAEGVVRSRQDATAAASCGSVIVLGLGMRWHAWNRLVRQMTQISAVAEGQRLTRCCAMYARACTKRDSTYIMTYQELFLLCSHSAMPLLGQQQ